MPNCKYLAEVYSEVVPQKLLDRIKLNGINASRTVYYYSCFRQLVLAALICNQ